MDKEAYSKSINRYKKGKKPPMACAVCGEDDEKVIEMHHVDGRNNSDVVKPLCMNCHSKVTAKQNRLSPKVRSKDASEENKKVVNAISLLALLRELVDRLDDIVMEMPTNV
ncbi:HNH endonuclease [Methanolobus vulcani]|uniref:HNH endonuclease n=1 Tax=Methanolobus vulcani TaxID=38026 RepID=A0A7Z8KQC7_9EURY|nr:HNH endonuclease [Methanolobus vulcani]TQD27913.1 HNH endonuclease [Methanolobus vulcani]